MFSFNNISIVWHSSYWYRRTYESIRAHTLRVTAAMLPRFLFPDGHIHDPNDMLRNVLCGHLIQRVRNCLQSTRRFLTTSSHQVAKLIFQGPSTALDEPGAHRGKQGNAALCGLTSMTPHTIAYVVVQVSSYLILSNYYIWYSHVSTDTFCYDFSFDVVDCGGDIQLWRFLLENSRPLQGWRGKQGNVEVLQSVSRSFIFSCTHLIITPVMSLAPLSHLRLAKIGTTKTRMISRLLCDNGRLSVLVPLQICPDLFSPISTLYYSTIFFFMLYSLCANVP